MGILSFFALVTAVLFAVVLYRRATSKLDLLNVFAVLVCGTLGWWALCDSFFYSAATKQAAWVWHHLSAVGWCGFIAVTAYYFLILSGANRKLSPAFKTIFWLIPIGLTLRFVLVQPTAMAADLVQSGSGLGWTFVQQGSNPWTFLFLSYLVIYLGGALVYLLFWQRREKKKGTRHLAVGFVLLDAVSVVVGFISIFVLPRITSFLPPMGFVALLIFLWGYCHELWDYDLSSIELALRPREVFDTSMDSMLVTDLHWHIIYANEAARQLLRWHVPLENRSCEEFLDAESQRLIAARLQEESGNIRNLSLRLDGQTQVIASISTVRTRRRRQTLLLVCFHDISQLKQAQRQMEQMAFCDELTGLPNRRQLGAALDSWEERHRVDGKDFALLFSDLNHFKSINDRFGHSAGDAALVAVGKTLRQDFTAGDEVFRLSGDEFVLLHTMVDGEVPEMLTRRLRQSVQAVNTAVFAPGISLDVSVGVCLYSEFHSAHQLMKAADERMYRMKLHSGRE